MPSSQFGRGMRQHFLFDKDWVNLNHGSFGTYPRQVADARSDFLRTVEQAPDVFLRYNHLPMLNKSRQQLAGYLHVPVDEIVLVENATLAITTVLRNLTFVHNDVILCLESVYDAIEMTLSSIQETLPQVRVHKVEFGDDLTKPEYPKTHDGICECFSQAVSQLESQGYRVKVAIFETISATPAVRLPFERLTELCKRKNILSLVDGAHGIGQIPLDLSDLDADFFISNCHKWLYVPRGCAIFHVPRRNQHLIRTAFPTSWEFESQSKLPETSNRFLNQFQAQATADNTPFYCVAAALEFREQVCGGETAIMQYSKDIVQRGAAIVADALGTVVMKELSTEGQSEDGISSSATASGICDCAMSNVLLPLTINKPGTNGITSDNVGQVTGWMQRVLPREYRTSVSIFEYRGRIWTRLSGQIYLELSDFEWFAGILVHLCERVNTGEPFKTPGNAGS